MKTARAPAIPATRKELPMLLEAPLGRAEGVGRPLELQAFVSHE